MMAGAASAQKPIKVACVGNSITYGYGIDDPQHNSYPAQLQQMLGDSYIVGNFGKSGTTVTRNGFRPYMNEPEFHDAMAFAGDIVVIHMGINDTDPRVWPHLADEFVGDYLALVDSLRSANPAAKFYIARLAPVTHIHKRFKSGTRDWRLQVQSLIESIAAYTGAQLIDFDAPLNKRTYLIPDAVHPTREGATLLAETVYGAITGDFGGLSMADVYTDGMVLPAGRNFQIAGRANAGEPVSVSIGNQIITVVTDPIGYWRANLLPLKGGEIYSLTVSTPERTLNFKDVQAGKVWLAAGQSNMEFPLRSITTVAEDIAGTSAARVRILNKKPFWGTSPGAWSVGALDSINDLKYFIPAKWQKTTPGTTADFSAIGYHFGRIIADSLDMPVGIICSTVGGPPIEAWISKEYLENYFPDILYDPIHNDFIDSWVRQRAANNIANSRSPELQRHPYLPAYLYDTAVDPYTTFPIDGILWYQGESSAHNIESFERLQPLVVDSWRDGFNAPDLPFLFVQLPSLNRKSWPAMRDAQRRFAASRRNDNIYMVVTTDKGDPDDVHYRDKRPIAERLANLALATQYGRSNITAQSPEFIDVTYCGDSVIIEMSQPVETFDGMDPTSFEVAELIGIYYPAKAKITPDNRHIILRSDSCQRIRHVRYDWRPVSEGNLTGASGLPVSTFSHSAPNDAKATDVSFTVTPMPTLTGSRDYSKGVSAAFAGRLGSRCIVAGGANFPVIPAADGGTKRYYDEVYYLTDNAKSWRRAKGALPYPVAYGASFTTAGSIICAGGITPDGPTNRVFALSIDGKGHITTDSMPPLPVTIDNAGAATIDNKLYIIGGNHNGNPSASAYVLDLDNLAAGWTLLASGLGTPLVTQPAATGCGRYLVSACGFAPRTPANPEPSIYSGINTLDTTDNAVFSETIPSGISLSGGTATALDNNRVLFTGGVNPDIFLQALRQPAPDYLTHPAEWYRFNDKLIVFHTDGTTNNWSNPVSCPEAARAGAMAVPDGQGGILLIGGELKPGMRTNSVVRITPLR